MNMLRREEGLLNKEELASMLKIAANLGGIPSFSGSSESAK